MSNDRCHRCLKGLSRRMPCFIAWTLLLVLTTIYFRFICPKIIEEFSLISIGIIHGIILFFVLNYFLLATLTDPGRYNRAPPDENDDSETAFHKTGFYIEIFIFQKKKKKKI